MLIILYWFDVRFLLCLNTLILEFDYSIWSWISKVCPIFGDLFLRHLRSVWCMFVWLLIHHWFWVSYMSMIIMWDSLLCKEAKSTLSGACLWPFYSDFKMFMCFKLVITIDNLHRWIVELIFVLSWWSSKKFTITFEAYLSVFLSLWFTIDYESFVSMITSEALW